ncbi:MAG: GAF domain-containing SpoIIE family protein phosphatase [Pseudomonadota bacterium]
MTKDNDISQFLITDHSPELKACFSKVERLSNCIEIANLINSELSIGKLLTNVMETTKKAFTADAVSMLLMDEKTGDLTFQIALGDVGDEIKELYRLKKGQGIAGLVAQTGQPLNIADAYDHPQFSPEYDQKTNYRTRAMLCVPLKIRGDVIGIIQVINKLTPPFQFTHDELEMLITIASSAAVAVDTAKMHKIILQRETLERDLRLAKEVQESFLPRELPLIDNYRFAALNQPALEIGGDFYNFFKLPANKLGIVLGDVSGKGISASLFMARLTSDLQYYTLLYPEPCDLLTQINDVLCERAKRGMFVTLVYMLLDTVENRIKIANAGHMSPIYCDDDGIQVLDTQSSKGPPLGIIPGIKYGHKTFELQDNSSITVYTDGVIEAKDSSDQLFGTTRLFDVIKKQPNDPTQIVDSISAAVDGFSMGNGRSDDLTLLVFSINTSKQTE